MSQSFSKCFRPNRNHRLQSTTSEEIGPDKNVRNCPVFPDSTSVFPDSSRTAERFFRTVSSESAGQPVRNSRTKKQKKNIPTLSTREFKFELHLTPPIMSLESLTRVVTEEAVSAVLLHPCADSFCSAFFLSPISVIFFCDNKLTSSISLCLPPLFAIAPFASRTSTSLFFKATTSMFNDAYAYLRVAALRFLFSPSWFQHSSFNHSRRDFRSRNHSRLLSVLNSSRCGNRRHVFQHTLRDWAVTFDRASLTCLVPRLRRRQRHRDLNQKQQFFL